MIPISGHLHFSWGYIQDQAAVRALRLTEELCAKLCFVGHERCRWAVASPIAVAKDSLIYWRIIVDY